MQLVVVETTPTKLVVNLQLHLRAIAAIASVLTNFVTDKGRECLIDPPLALFFSVCIIFVSLNIVMYVALGGLDSLLIKAMGNNLYMMKMVQTGCRYSQGNQ